MVFRRVRFVVLRVILGCKMEKLTGGERIVMGFRRVRFVVLREILG